MCLKAEEAWEAAAAERATVQFAIEYNAVAAVAADYMLHNRYSMDLLDSCKAAVAVVRIQRTSLPQEPSSEYTVGYDFVAADRILHISHYLDPSDHIRYPTYCSASYKETCVRSQELIK